MDSTRVDIWTLEVTKKSLFSIAAMRSSPSASAAREFPRRLQNLSRKRKGFGRFFAGKKFFDCNNLFHGSIQTEFHHSILILVVERLSFFSKSK